MPNILKSRRVNMVDEVVRIGDAFALRPKPRKKPEGEPGEEDFVALSPEGLEQGSAQAAGDYADEADYDNMSAVVQQAPGMELGAVQQEILQSAMGEAGRILEDAVHSAQEQKEQILAQAQYEVDRQRQEAVEEGRRQGFATVSSEVGQIANQIEESIAAFEGERAGFEAEYEQELKWLAMEIASKVLSKKISADDAEMLEMVDKAVQSVRGEAWIRVDVAQDMVNLIDRLNALYSENDNISVSPVSAQPGTVTIESPSGIVDASLQTQLSNLKEYFQKAQI